MLHSSRAGGQCESASVRVDVRHVILEPERAQDGERLGCVNFNIARIITGVGIGAVLAIVNTYINEVAPRHSRAKYTTVIFVMSVIGALLGIWLGLILTTPSTPWPMGLPFALASKSFGWRWMYGLGALLAFISVVLLSKLPESPRWLISQGRMADASAIVSDMELRAERHGPLPEPNLADVDTAVAAPRGCPTATCSARCCTGGGSCCSS